MRRLFFTLIFLVLVSKLVLAISITINTNDNVTMPSEVITVTGTVNPSENISLFINDKWFDNITVDAGAYEYNFTAPEGVYSLEGRYWNTSTGWEHSSKITQVVKSLEISVTMDKYAHESPELVKGSTMIRYWNGTGFENYTGGAVFLEDSNKDVIANQSGDAVTNGVGFFSFSSPRPGPYFIKVNASDPDGIEAEEEAVFVVGTMAEASTAGLGVSIKPLYAGYSKKIVLVNVSGTYFPAELRVLLW